jgi:glycosyltransferase involved in cell wall biosynthesis
MGQRPQPKIAIVGNLANVGYNLAKFLRWRGVDAKLHPSDAEWKRVEGSRSVLGVDSPANEDTSPVADAIGASYSVGPYRRRVRRLCFSLGFPHWSDVYRILAGADLIHAHTGTAVWAAAVKRGLGVPFIAVTTGADISELAFEDSPGGRAYIASLRQADLVLLSNTGQWKFADKLELKEPAAAFIPLAIDCDKYSPGPPPDRRDYTLLFSVSRLDWSQHRRKSLKRNDLFFRALARYLKDHPDVRVKLRIADWGIDREPTRRLIECLGLSPVVEYVPPGDKARLLRLYREADVIVDQFFMGSAGLSCLEGMAVGKPVLIHWDREMIRRCYVEAPPVLGCATEDEIYSQLGFALAAECRRELGMQARTWVMRHHHWTLVTDLLIRHYERVLRRRVL